MYTGSSASRSCIQEQQQEMLAQVSMVVFTTGLAGRPPVKQFPALPTEKGTGCRAQRTVHRMIRLPCRYTILRPEDIKSYLPRGPDMRQVTCSAGQT
jgi:hypothetical protein